MRIQAHLQKGRPHPVSWFVYILECRDQTLYTGITNDLERRLAQHESGKGAKYTRGRGPFRLVHSEAHPTRAEASRREYGLKKLDRTAKLALACQR
jgi:putative endonuclease